ncbi:MAG: ADP-ribosylglycohydrolase family protein [Phycisphaerales bacterium JB041]
MRPTERTLAGGRVFAAAAALLLAPAVSAQGTRLLDRAAYADSLRGMWLGQCIANWTGLRSEGKVTQPPFLTDADWGRDLGKGPLEFVLGQDPWLSDDDTDVEYVALHRLDELGVTELTGRELADAWLAHMDEDFLWVSNQNALDLMHRGVTPPGTSLPAANRDRLAIDAQLTTEMFGALAPGMPREALAMAEVPISATARGHAAQAAQTFMLLYCLAGQADPALAPRERILWLVGEARRYLPETSKAADIVDVVVADYLANPDPDDWERTRDLVYDRYQLHDEANGFRYRTWVESSVNFAAGLIALLYGEGDFLRTVQIGTLTGWDSDNGTATMGGLLGLMLGHEGLVEQIRLSHPGYVPSDRYDIERTRDNLPDYLDGDPEAQDTFTLMAQRMLAIVEARVLEAGGLVDDERGLWLLPPVGGGDRVGLSPRQDLFRRSGNSAVRLAGGTVSVWSSVTSDPPGGYGTSQRKRFADGFELDDSGADTLDDSPRVVYSTLGAGQAPGDPVEIRVTYDRPVVASSVLVVEGDHFPEGPYVGGWFASVSAVQVRVAGVWVDPPGGFAAVPRLDPAVPFQMLEWRLAVPVEMTGVRVVGAVGGPAAFAMVAEVDALGPPGVPDRATFDLDANGALGVDDIYWWHRSPVDLDGDGLAGADDLRYLTAAVRWRELDDMRGGTSRP